jgi:hypothetical protein
MAIKNFPTPVMISITGPWLDPTKDQPALAAHPKIAPYLPNLAQAHHDLLTQQHHAPDNSAVKALGEQADAADTLHDRKLRGAYNLLGALADLSDDPVQSQALISMQGKLSPEGLSVNTLSYTAEAGNAAMAAQRLTAADREELRAIPVLGETLEAHVDAWIAAGAQLGELSRKRSQAAAVNTGPSLAQVNAARINWIRVVNAILGAEMFEPFDDATHQRVFGPLESIQDASSEPVAE